ncbi:MULTISPECIES: putative toxin-antitoxin system toxin component, PIN family [unclassified Acidovorax]|jgi:putative PIN family toxin of toxin-antitoxin system|uniref:putative toxin-antitoxin system toxin component, PIN family n=1 Tax=unclassified Acidovorax TaxID=2684926 RepID=UPI000B401B0A|nr:MULTISPECIES: putative toxin-antitoxin system toxin component, PIN family [unclassified Acidovorax]MBP3981797.1 putative toxin-antitoxin system toxin component, PIN family [Acidovorax sp. JG5]
MAAKPPRCVLPLPERGEPGADARALVLDTNIVLDLLLFADAAVAPVRALLDAQRLCWVATPPMRDELARVLAYPQIAPRLAFYGLTASALLQSYEAQVRWVDVAPRVAAVCKDADDQHFIDLAVAHRAILLSKDKAVLCMRKRLLALGAHAATAIVFEENRWAGDSPERTATTPSALPMA